MADQPKRRRSDNAWHTVLRGVAAAATAALAALGAGAAIEPAALLRAAADALGADRPSASSSSTSCPEVLPWTLLPRSD